MVNLDWLLQNMTNLTINNSLIEDPQEIIPNMVENANNLSQGYWGLGFMTISFIVMFWVVTREDKNLNLDIPRGLLVASGFTSVLGIIGIISPIFVSYIHVIWFISIFIISYIWLIILNKAGKI